MVILPATEKKFPFGMNIKKAVNDLRLLKYFEMLL